MLGLFLLFSRKSGDIRRLEVTFIMLCYKVRWEVVGNDAAEGIRESPGFNFGLFCGYDKHLFISYFPR